MHVWTRRLIAAAVALTALAAANAVAAGVVKVGEPAPAFTATDLEGKPRSLAG